MMAKKARIYTCLLYTSCKKRLIEVVGLGHGGDTLTAATKQSLTSFAATRMAAEQAYKLSLIHI